MKSSDQKDHDSRNTPRQECQSMGEVHIDSSVFRGPISDISDGIGVIIKNSPYVVKGARAHIKVLEDKLEFQGEIVWVEALDFDFVRIGLKRTANVKSNPAFEEEVNEIVVTDDETHSGLREDGESASVQGYAGSSAGSEKKQQKKKWPYMIAGFFLVMLLGLAIMYDKSIIPFSPPELTVAKKHGPPLPITSIYPSFRNTAVTKAYHELSEYVPHYPVFLENTLKRLRENKIKYPSKDGKR